MSAALDALTIAIATNTLTTAQQSALTQALSVISPLFPSPDDSSSADAPPDTALAREWIAALYAIQAGGGGGGIVPITSVIGTPPIETVTAGPVVTVSIDAATPAAAGSLSAADKTKLNGLTPGAAVASVTASAPLASSGGNNPNLTIAAATDSTPGSMSAADKTKLDAITVGGISVASGAALTALATTGFVIGELAYVQSFGALWAYQPASTLTPDGSTVLAAAGGGNWLRGPSLVTEQYVQAAALFVDGTSGNDESNGTTSGTAFKHMQEIARRWGTKRPALAQATTITMVTSNTAADPFDFEPTFVSSGSLLIVGTLTASVTSTIGAFTAAVRGGANTRGTITSPGVASWAGLAGTLIRDTTAGATFFVSADLGGGVAAITNAVHFPIPTFPAPAAVVIANGDAIQLFTPPTLFATRVGRSSLSSAGVSVQLNALTLNASNGVYVELDNAFLSEVNIAAIVTRDDVSLLGSSYVSCYVGGQYLGSGSFVAGKLVGTTSILSSVTNAQGATFDGDIELAGALLMLIPTGFGSVYISGAWSQQRSTSAVVMRPSATYGPSGRGLLWGPGTVAIQGGGQCDASGGGGTAAQQFVNTGGLTLDGAAAGSVFTQSTGLWSAGTVAITPAAIDTNLAFSNPRTGSRIHI